MKRNGCFVLKVILVQMMVSILDTWLQKIWSPVFPLFVCPRRTTAINHRKAAFSWFTVLGRWQYTFSWRRRDYLNNLKQPYPSRLITLRGYIKSELPSCGVFPLRPLKGQSVTGSFNNIYQLIRIYKIIARNRWDPARSDKESDAELYKSSVAVVCWKRK